MMEMCVLFNFTCRSSNPPEEDSTRCMNYSSMVSSINTLFLGKFVLQSTNRVLQAEAYPVGNNLCCTYWKLVHQILVSQLSRRQEHQGGEARHI